MASLTECMQIVARMSREDQDELVGRVDTYVASGIAPADAQIAAANDLLAEIEADQASIMALAQARLDAERPMLSQAETPAPEPQAGPGFYSALRRELAAAKTNAGTAEYWGNLIKGALNKGAVKADEVRWSGVNDWLQAQEGKIPKARVLEWFDDQGGVRVGETVLGETIPGRELDRWLDRWADKNPDTATARAINQGLSWDEIADTAKGEGQSVVQRLLENQANPAKFGQYTLPGGENYAERLLTLPVDQYLLDQVTAAREAWRSAINRDASQEEVDRLKAAYDAARVALGTKKPYKSIHWDGVPNVIAHIRMNDRTDADGKRVLFVEELQSDWAQAGRKSGFGGATISGFKFDNAQNDWVKADDSEATHFGDASGRDDTLWTSREEATRKLKAGVPTAPFVQTTDGWLNLSLKRVIKLAVDGGYDRVAFTTGEQNAERYDLSKQIDRIDYNKNGDGTFNMSAIRGGAEVFSKENLTEAEVADTVGKELAAKMVRGEGKPAQELDPVDRWEPEDAEPDDFDFDAGPVVSLSGLDLKVGGEGMRAFYDKIVPAALKKLLPKVGGGQMGVVNLLKDSMRKWDRALMRDDLERLGESGFRAKYAHHQQPGFDITPQMRERVADGLPLFSQRETEPQQRGINIRNDGDNRYADLIVDGKKIMESRDSDSLRPYVGKTVGIIRTGEGSAKLIGSVKIGEPIKVNERRFRQLESRHLVPAGSRFDIKPGGEKFLYPLTDAKRFDEERDVDSLGMIARSVQFSQREAPDTPEFKRWFGNSKVVDDNGKPMVMYHGTSRNQNGEAFTLFDTYGSEYGLFGTGSYFTREPMVASEYTRKGRGSTPTVYPVYLSIKNPLDMEAPADPERWMNAFPDVDFADVPSNPTNEQVFRAVEEYLADARIPKWEAADMVTEGFRSMGHDGVTHIGGGRVNKTNPVRHRVFIAFDPEQIKSAIGNRGTFDPNDPDIRYAQAQGGAQPQTWQTLTDSKWDDFVYQVQDKQVDLKRVTETLREAGAQFTDRSDAYLRESLYHGRVADRIKRFSDNELMPLFTEMKAAGVTMEDLGQYLHARHAPERNAEMKARNLNRQNNDALSGMTDQEAANIMAAAPPAMARLAARVDAIIEGTRNLMEISGIETAATVDALRNSFQHYVPLHRDEAHPDQRASTGMGYSVRGSVVRTAVGSTEAVDPRTILAYIMDEREAVITRAEKNLVALALYQTALQNPNPEWWTVDRPPQKGFIDERAMVFNPGRGVMEPNPNQGQVVFRTDPTYKGAENVIVLQVNGEDRVIVFNERNERAVRMASALKNLDAIDVAFAQKWIGTPTRWLASVNTQYNPVFMVVNAIRDLQGAAINLTNTPINGAQAELLNPASLAAIAREIFRMEQGKPAVNQTWRDIVDEFRMRGGQTGYKDMFENVHDRADKLERKMRSIDRGGAMGAMTEVADFVSAANTAVENMVRVAAYKAARDRGLSKDRAASLARELTVNFNRKGAQVGQLASVGYAFFNSAVQGNVRAYQALANPKTGKAIIIGGIMLGVLQALLLEATLDDEEQENIKEWQKRTSYIIPRGEGKVFAIPMPLGFHVLPNIGRILTETAIAKAKGEQVNVTAKALQLASTVLDALNPLGAVEDPVQLLAPTLADPLVQLQMNRSGLGSPIYREREQGDAGAPGYTLARDSTSPVYKAIAYGIHVATQPDAFARDPDLPAWMSPQPEAIRLIPETIFGGIWRETEKLIDTAGGMLPGREVDKSRIPLISRFNGDLRDDKAPMNAFYRNLEQIQAADRRVRRATEAGVEVNAPLAELASDAGRVRREIRDMIEQRRQLTLEGAPEADIKAIEKEMAELMREFNAAVRDVRRSREEMAAAEQ